MSERLWSLPDLAAKWGHKYDAVKRRAQRQQIKTVRFGRRVYVAQAEVDRIEAGEPMPDVPAQRTA